MDTSNAHYDTISLSLHITFGGMCSCRSWGVACFLPLCLTADKFFVLLISPEAQKTWHQWEPPDGSVRGSRPAKLTKRCFIRYLSAGRKAIAYTDLL